MFIHLAMLMTSKPVNVENFDLDINHELHFLFTKLRNFMLFVAFFIVAILHCCLKVNSLLFHIPCFIIQLYVQSSEFLLLLYLRFNSLKF